MQRHKLLRTHRQTDYNYSTPAFYHLLIETRGKAAILATENNGVFTLSEAGSSFLDTIGRALQNIPALRIHAMSIRPSTVELLVEITAWRNKQEEPERGTPEWVQWRRTMTLAVFVGYLKMNSGMQINAQAESSGSVWTRRYRERVVTDAEEIASLQSELLGEWSRIIVPIGKSKKKQVSQPDSFSAALQSEFGETEDLNVEQLLSKTSVGFWQETMILGRVQLLTGVRRSEQRAASTDLSVVAGDGTDGRRSKQTMLIRSLGPGRLFLSG